MNTIINPNFSIVVHRYQPPIKQPFPIMEPSPSLKSSFSSGCYSDSGCK